jgi:hypothetical protein
MHLGRAALISWVAVILLPGAVTALGVVRQPSSSQAALLGVSSSAGAGIDRLGAVTTDMHGAEDAVRRFAARLQLESERFIAQLP